jgi:hypothetical protein
MLVGKDSTQLFVGPEVPGTLPIAYAQYIIAILKRKTVMLMLLATS